MALVREFGGVLEHPAGSTLWAAQKLPRPGERDQYGGWTLAAPQKWWGHKAEKYTWFYVVGVEPGEIPDVPYVMGEAAYVVQSSKRQDYRPHITKAEREHTPPPLCAWLVELAAKCKTHNECSAGLANTVISEAADRMEELRSMTIRLVGIMERDDAEQLEDAEPVTRFGAIQAAKAIG